MDPLLFSSLGLVFIGAILASLIYQLGPRKIAGTPEFSAANRWTIVFALFICTFFGAAPFLIEHAIWLLALPFAGLSMSLLTIQKIVQRATESRENYQTG